MNMNEYRDSVTKLVEAWFTEGSEYDLCEAAYEEPGIVWEAIVRIVARESQEERLAMLAAGPLELLLAQHGEMFIEKVEVEAAVNPRLKHLLGGVWRHEMPESVWERVEKIRGTPW